MSRSLSSATVSIFSENCLLPNPVFSIFFKVSINSFAFSFTIVINIKSGPLASLGFRILLFFKILQYWPWEKWSCKFFFILIMLGWLLWYKWFHNSPLGSHGQPIRMGAGRKVNRQNLDNFYAIFWPKLGVLSLELYSIYSLLVYCYLVIWFSSFACHKGFYYISPCCFSPNIPFYISC